MKINHAIFIRLILGFLFILTSTLTVQAQYFGQNKVRYKNVKFKVLQTPHFEIYYYIKNKDLVERFAQDAETWYKMHQDVFRDIFQRKEPHYTIQ